MLLVHGTFTESENLFLFSPVVGAVTKCHAQCAVDETQYKLLQCSPRFDPLSSLHIGPLTSHLIELLSLNTKTWRTSWLICWHTWFIFWRPRLRSHPELWPSY